MQNLKFLTVTWRGDLTHFSLLRESLNLSRLSGVEHDVVVHSEDFKIFNKFQQPGLNLYTTHDLLDPVVERRRIRARHCRELLGRRSEVICGSLSRTLGWPNWVRYTGWHIQQICKLAGVAASKIDVVVLLDSDLIITKYADASDFLSLPPRRWSEFGIYKQFLRNHYSKDIVWRSTEKMGYIFDASSTEKLIEQFNYLLEHDRSHYITIHSQSSGRRLWGAEHYRDSVLKALSN